MRSWNRSLKYLNDILKEWMRIYPDLWLNLKYYLSIGTMATYENVDIAITCEFLTEQTLSMKEHY